jgi:serine/threonine protein kinase
VFLAKNLENKLTVAIKKMPNDTSKTIASNFMEILLLKECNHPNILRYVESWKWKNEIWIITEYMEGGTLQQALQTQKLSEDEMSFVARQVYINIISRMCLLPPSSSSSCSTNDCLTNELFVATTLSSRS